MKLSPTFSEYSALAKEYAVVPLFVTLLLDDETPVSLFNKLDGGSSPLFLLESVQGQVRFSRYSFIGCDALDSFSAVRGKISWPKSFPLPQERGSFQNPFSALAHFCSFRGPRLPQLPPFYGGLVGFLGYEAVRYLEKVPTPAKETFEAPDIFFYLAQSLLIFDHYRRTLTVTVVTFPRQRVRQAYAEGAARVRELAEAVRSPLKRAKVAPQKKSRLYPLRSNFTPSAFKRAVQRARRYIAEGECIQTVLSQRFSLSGSFSDMAIYRGLRFVNPSPYLYLFRTPFGSLIGSSPELLVRVQGDRATVRPIAGTRPRGITEAEDQKLEEELRADAKELAEHVMLVDLGRNDLGRVCEVGSVKLSEYLTVERYSHVMHLVSEVSGTLAPEKNLLDALAATFPAGTVTGAPKVRAMEIIAELEPEARGPYSGALGYLSWTGDMDMAIILRTLFKRGRQVSVQAGAGIVYDSSPQREYEETRNKAQGVLAALQLVQRHFEL